MDDTAKRESELDESGSQKRFKLDSDAINEPQQDVVDVPVKGKARKPLSRKKDRSSKKNVDGRRGTRPDTATDGIVDSTDTSEKMLRLPKRLCALLVGYSGSGFSGMQIQLNVRTIEGELFKALVQAGAVSKDNSDDPVKVGLQRAARTDAGVHAAGNVVSLKIITAVPDVPDLVARINEALPPEIRLWDFVRVQNSFNARLSCDSRKYTYFFPTYLLIPPKPGSGLHRSFQVHSQSSADAQRVDDHHPFWQGVDLNASREEDMLRKKKWRISPEQVDLLRVAAKKYEGTHNFHNFTVGHDFKDKSCARFMKKIEISDPVVYGETEWISVMLHGQSFMLHQRKMICVLVLALRTSTPVRVIDELYNSPVVMVPKMPSLGLLLEQPIFGSYNARMREVSAKLEPSSPDHRPAVEFDQHHEKMQAFKDSHIYSRMRSSEERFEVFDRWICSIDRYSGQDLAYFNARGVVPEACIIKKGVKRASSFKEKRRFDATDFNMTEEPAKAFPDDDQDEVEEV